MKLSLNQQSADALRVFAEQMPKAIDQIDAATEKLLEVYARVEGRIGVHEQDFYDMLKRLEAVQKQAREPILQMPYKLNQVANSIEDYLKTRPDLGGYPGN